MANFPAEEKLFWHESPSNVLPANVFEENSNLLPRLRWLSWRSIPPTFKITLFSLEDMVFLDLSYSKITHNWKGWSHMEAMENLKVLNLSHCDYLERTPDFSALSNLERLILVNCRRLVEIDGSICHLKRLAFLDVHGCGKLQRLPDEIGNLESLIELNIAETKIEELPDSFGNLKNLKILERRSTRIREILNVLWRMEKLEEIREVQIFSGNMDLCIYIDKCIYRNQSLKILKLEYFFIRAVPKLPESLVTLHLSWLYMDTFHDLSNLTNLKVLELWFLKLSKREYLDLSSPHVSTSPADLALPPQLKELHLRSCPNLRRLPRLPSSLSSLRFLSCESLESIEDLDLSSPQLKELRIEYGHNLRRFPRLPSTLSSLHLSVCPSLCSAESLDLRSPHVTTSPTDLTLPPHLKELKLHDLPNLRRLPRLPSSLSSLCLEICESLCSMEDLSNLKNLSSLYIWVAAIEEIQGKGSYIWLPEIKFGRRRQNLNLNLREKTTNLNMKFEGER